MAETQQFMRDRNEAAEIVYNDLKASQRAAGAIFADYGKWLVSSLVLINAGALAGLFSFIGTFAKNPDALAAFQLPIWAFVIGLALALACGFLAWANWGIAADDFDQQADPSMLWDPNKWKNEPAYQNRMFWTYWGAITVGIASVASSLVGAAFVLHGKALASVLGVG